jgi:hypothetical protein
MHKNTGFFESYGGIYQRRNSPRFTHKLGIFCFQEVSKTVLFEREETIRNQICENCADDLRYDKAGGVNILPRF